jgi:hypothetical protein
MLLPHVQPCFLRGKSSGRTEHPRAWIRELGAARFCSSYQDSPESQFSPAFHEQCLRSEFLKKRARRGNLAGVLRARTDEQGERGSGARAEGRGALHKSPQCASMPFTEGLPQCTCLPALGIRTEQEAS